MKQRYGGEDEEKNKALKPKSGRQALQKEMRKMKVTEKMMQQKMTSVTILTDMQRISLMRKSLPDLPCSAVVRILKVSSFN